MFRQSIENGRDHVPHCSRRFVEPLCDDIDVLGGTRSTEQHGDVPTDDDVLDADTIEDASNTEDELVEVVRWFVEYQRVVSELHR